MFLYNSKTAVVIKFKNCLYISEFYHLSPSLKMNKTPPFHMPLQSSPVLLSPQSSFLEQSLHSPFSPRILLIHNPCDLELCFHDSMETASYGAQSPVALKRRIQAALFLFVCHWHCPQLSTPSSLSPLAFELSGLLPPILPTPPRSSLPVLRLVNPSFIHDLLLFLLQIFSLNIF